MSDRDSEVIELVARITGRAPQDVRLGAVDLSSPQLAALDGLCRKRGIDTSKIGLGSVIGLGHLAAAQRAEMPIPAAAPLQNIQPGFGRIAELGRLGCDVQDIGEFKQCIDNTDYKRSVFLAEFASPEEIAYCENRPDPVASLAGLMAAKEAILKAGHHGPLKSIPVEHENGAPVTRGFTLSVSHSANTAFAVALRFNDVSSLFRSAQAKSELDGVEQTTRVPSGWQRAAWAIYHVALLAAVAFLFVFSAARR